MGTLKREYVRRCYGISWDSEAVALLLKIEKRILPQMKEMLNSNPFFIKTRQSLIPEGILYNFKEIGETGKSFGLENQFVYESEDDTDMVYRWLIPPVVYQTEEICPECNGSLVNFANNPCYYCRQTGKKYDQVPNNNFAAGMITLHILFNIFSMFMLDDVLRKEIEQDERRQILHVEISATTGIYTCWIVGWVSNEVIAWVDESPNEDSFPILHAMASVEERLFCRKTDSRDFRLFVNTNKNFWLKVPGNACTLGTEGGMNMYNTGANLSPHNVDHRTAQLSFIAGLAALSDQIT